MQLIIYTLLTSNIVFVCIIVCIQEFCYLTISDQLLSKLSEWEMMWPYLIPTLSASNSRQVDPITIFWEILLDFITFPHPAPFFRFAWCFITSFKYLHNVYEVGVESHEGGYMDESGITVIIQTDLLSALTAHSMTSITSLTYISFVFIVTIIALA